MKVPDITGGERGDYGEACNTRGPENRFVCTRPPHSRLTLHAAGYLRGVLIFWADSENTR